MLKIFEPCRKCPEYGKCRKLELISRIIEKQLKTDFSYGTGKEQLHWNDLP